MKLLLVKLISKLILPPGVFVLILFSISILLGIAIDKYGYYKINRKKYIYRSLFIVALLLYLLSSYCGELLLVKPLEEGFIPLEKRQMTLYDNYKSAIVVLGGGVVRGTPRGVEVGTQTLRRLYTAWRVHQSEGWPIVVSGGKPLINSNDSKFDSTEAEVMRDALLELGVSKSKIILEDESNNTWQNAVNTTSLLQKLDYEQIVLVTNATHMSRALFSFKQHWQAQLLPAPAGYKLESEVGLVSYLPNQKSLYNSLAALHEWVGLLWYKLKE
ncbi:MAG: YdcF family protein [Bacillota bacterium]